MTFEDGTKESGNLLIGAEGAHSPTREFILGPKEAALLPSPVVASVTITTLDREASIAMHKLHRRYTISFHPNGTFTWHSSKPLSFPIFVLPTNSNSSKFMTAPAKNLLSGPGCLCKHGAPILLPVLRVMIF